MKRILALALTIALILTRPSPTLAFWGVGDTSDAILAQILVENTKEAADTATHVQQLREMIATARNNYEFARSTYAIASSIQHFDSDRFLQEARSDFMASQPVFAQAQGLAHDMMSNGLRGGQLSYWAVLHQIDIFREDERAKKCGCDLAGAPANRTDIECQFTCQAAHARGYPFTSCRKDGCGPASTPSSYTYDEASAERLSGALGNMVHDEQTRQKLLDSPAPPDTSDALVFLELARASPSAANALVRRRALAAKAGASAHENSVSAASTSLNQGTASAITARSTSLAAEQLAAINDQQAQQLSIEKGKVAQEARDREASEKAIQIHALHLADVLFIALNGQDRTPPGSSSSAWSQ